MAALRATATEPAAQPGEQLGCTAGDLLGMSECRPRQGQGEGRSRGGGDLRVPCNCHAACASVVRFPEAPLLALLCMRSVCACFAPLPGPIHAA